MNNPSGMRVSKCLGNLHAVPERLAQRLRPFRQLFPERLTFYEFHYDERLPPIRINVVDRTDARMVQGGSRARLLLKPLESAAVFVELFQRKFQSDESAEPGIERFVYDAHSAFSDPLQNLVVR